MDVTGRQRCILGNVELEGGVMLFFFLLDMFDDLNALH